MSKVINRWSWLTMTLRFMGNFFAATLPRFALGLVEEHGKKHGLLFFGQAITFLNRFPIIRWGHVLLGTKAFEVVQFMFEFDRLRTYNVVLNPSLTAFRNPLEEGDPFGLKANLPRILQSRTTETQYQKALSLFERRPDPPGKLLQWVCRDNVDYLNLIRDRLELRPS